MWRSVTSLGRIRSPLFTRRTFSTQPRHHDWTRDDVMKWISDYDRRTKINGVSMLKWGGGIGLTTVGCCLWYKDSIYSYISGESAKIAEQTISHERVLQQTNLLTKQVTENLLNDEQVMEIVVAFLMNVLNKEESHQLVSTFVQGLIEDQELQKQLFVLLKQVVMQLSEDPEALESLVQMTKRLLNHQETIEETEQLTIKVVDDPRSTKQVTALFQEVLEDPQLQEQFEEIVKETVVKVMNDPAIIRETGDYAWFSLWKMVTPRRLQ